jgi:hypothetical protein
MVAAFALAACPLACNAILGIDAQHLRPDAAAASSVGTDANTDAAGPEEAGADAGSVYAAAVMADRPALYARFGERSGPSAVEAAGHHDGTYPATGVTLGVAGALTGDVDTAIELVGGAAIRFPDGVDFAGNGPFSVEVWMRRDPSLPDAFILDHETYPRTGWSLFASGSSIFFERWGKGEHPVAAANQAVPDQAWHYLAATYDGQTMKLYVDGALGEAKPASNAIAAVTGGWSVGGQNCECQSNFLAGGLDELAVYDHALEPSQIAAHYQAAGR